MWLFTRGYYWSIIQNYPNLPQKGFHMGTGPYVMESILFEIHKRVKNRDRSGTNRFCCDVYVPMITRVSCVFFWGIADVSITFLPMVLLRIWSLKTFASVRSRQAAPTSRPYWRIRPQPLLLPCYDWWYLHTIIWWYMVYVKGCLGYEGI